MRGGIQPVFVLVHEYKMANITYFPIDVHVIIHYILLLLLLSNPQQAAVTGTISLGVQGKRKDRKMRKSRSKEKLFGFSSASLFPPRK